MSSFVVRSAGHIRLVIPTEVLHPRELGVEISSVTDLTRDDDSTIFSWIRTVTNQWDTFLLLARCDRSEERPTMSWRIIPYSNIDSGLMQRLSIGWRTLWGATPVTPSDDYKRATEILFEDPQLRPILCSDAHITATGLSSEQAIDTQQVFEGKTVRLLLNYAPQIAPPHGLHWIFIPKQSEDELTEEMWSEMMDIIRKLQYHYQAQYPLSWIRYADSATAGRSQKIFNLHLIMGTSASDEAWTKIKIMVTELIGPSRLSQEALADLVSTCQAELATVLH